MASTYQRCVLRRMSMYTVFVVPGNSHIGLPFISGVIIYPNGI